VNFKIFGRNVEINFDKTKYPDLGKELSLYNFSTGKPDVIVNIVKEINIPKKYIQNPKIHYTFKNGFLAFFGNTKIMYLKRNNLLEIFFEEPKKSSFAFVKRFLNMEFASVKEQMGQILHELIFVPMNYFFEDKFLVHSSAFQSPNGKTFLIGGTGGIGKTSLELFLCRNKNFSFIADDISIIDGNSKVYPNLSFPKIYGYNVFQKGDLKKVLLSDRTLMNKLHWKLSIKLRGKDKVRRKISPKKLYKSYLNYPVKLDTYFILTKKADITSLQKRVLDLSDAVTLTIKIIQNEYSTFHQHIVWHEYNALLNNWHPIVTLNNTYSNWRKLSERSFSNANLFILEIPESWSHQEFLKNFYTEIIEK
jgi:hypothetical protein